MENRAVLSRRLARSTDTVELIRRAVGYKSAVIKRLLIGRQPRLAMANERRLVGVTAQQGVSDLLLEFHGSGGILQTGL